MSLNRIGVATKPQALKGQFRIKPEIINLKLFKKLTHVSIDNVKYCVESVSLRDTFVIIKLEGIDTCEQAETFRNKLVFAEVEIEKVESNIDFVGFEVLVENEKLGNVTDVNNFGSKDILSVTGKRNFMLPVIDNLIVSVNEHEKTLCLDKNILEQVAVYED